jgi:Mrp family chromosome partitioning ATPase
MSKIQQALDKSREQRTAAAAPGADAVSRANSTAPSYSMTPIQRSQALAVMADKHLLSTDILDARHVVHPRMADREVLDGYRGLRSTLMRRVNGHANLVCVTSVWPKGHDGLVAANLATVIAADESRSALLIDCNLSHPSANRLFDLEEGPGLSDYLADESIGVAAVIRPAGVRRLRVIPVGKGSPQGDCFLMRRMKDLVADIRSRYDDRLIVLSAPPIGSCADAAILAEQSDYVVLSVPYGKVTMTEISEAVRAVSAQKVAGVIFCEQPRFPAINAREMIIDVFRQFMHPVDTMRRVFGVAQNK